MSITAGLNKIPDSFDGIIKAFPIYGTWVGINGVLLAMYGKAFHVSALIFHRATSPCHGFGVNFAVSVVSCVFLLLRASAEYGISIFLDYNYHCTVC